jgi:ubiquinone/menaquinone biosynthesis C-methylase UbiE
MIWKNIMMPARRNRVCPVKLAGSLDTTLRSWLQNPQKILQPFINEGMTVVDFGCGPGFFSVAIARLVGRSGRVIATDLQEGMLAKVREKIQGTEFEERIILHQCTEDTIGITDQVDFVLAFYMVHEIPEKESFFNKINQILKPYGKMLIVEPPFHVSRSEFIKTLEIARKAGFSPAEGPRVFLSKTAILQKVSTDSTTINTAP